MIEFSYDSLFVATKSEEVPNAVWIWDVSSVELQTILIHINPVKSFKFAPASH